MRKNRLSAYRRSQSALQYTPPPPPSDADRRRSLFGSLLRVARMILLHQIFGRN
jgi:hypothetical protein